MIAPIFPTPESYDERKAAALEIHLSAADLCEQRREDLALPLLRDTVNALAALQAERPDDGALAWRYICALHSLGISAVVTGRMDEGATAAATALTLARQWLPFTKPHRVSMIEDEIRKLERLQQATGAGVALLSDDGAAWPYDD